MIERFVNDTEVEIIVSSAQWLCWPTHWAGRTVLCGVRDCVMCDFERPRLLAYFAAKYRGRTVVVEANTSLFDGVNYAMRRLQLETPFGLALRFARASRRRPWRLIDFEHRPEGLTDVGLDAIWLGVARLFRLPDPRPGETGADWQVRVSAAHQVLMRRSLLPGLAEG